MTYRELANLIPADERREILQENLIKKAIAVANNPCMHHLMVVWRMYVEPTLIIGSCNTCYDRVFKSFKALQPAMIELEKEDRMLTEA